LFIPVHSSSVKGLSGRILDKYFTDNSECLTICTKPFIIHPYWSGQGLSSLSCKLMSMRVKIKKPLWYTLKNAGSNTDQPKCWVKKCN